MAQVVRFVPCVVGYGFAAQPSVPLRPRKRTSAELKFYAPWATEMKLFGTWSPS
jgi:hypothetical protein